MTRLLVVALFTIITLPVTLFAQSLHGLNTHQISQLTGAPGKIKIDEGIYKVYQKRDDLKISMSGLHVMPAMGLTSWVAFKKMTNETKIVGDLVLTEDQINPVMNVVLESGFHITSLENHYLWESPKVMFMHIEGSGSTIRLASQVGKIFKAITQTSLGNGNFPLATVDVTKTNLNPHRIGSILGTRSTFQNGVYKFNLSQPAANDNEFDNRIGMNTWASFAGSDTEAVVVGDFAIESTVAHKVLATLQHTGLYVVSIRQQIANENQSILLIHYMGVGNPAKLAHGIHAAMNIKAPPAIHKSTAPTATPLMPVINPNNYEKISAVTIPITELPQNTTYPLLAQPTHVSEVNINAPSISSSEIKTGAPIVNINKS